MLHRIRRNPHIARHRRLPLLAATALPGIFLFCVNDYNPFADPSNAVAKVVEMTFGVQPPQDSIRIFSAETMTVVLALRELLDSFSIAIPGDRIDSMRTWRPADSAWEDPSFSVVFSMADTGAKIITVSSFRSKGERIDLPLPVRVYSPLRQAPVAANLGERVRLATDTVEDSDVLYHWDFGAGGMIASPTGVVDTTFSGILNLQGQGRLWVSDTRNVKRSPAVAFDFMFDDIAGPVISLASGDSDTVYAPASAYRMSLSITDAGTGVVQNPQIEIPGRVQSFPLTRGADGLYTVTIPGPFESDRALQVIVKARDGIGRESSHTFWILSSESPVKPGLILKIHSPTGDQVWGARNIQVVGTVESYTSGTVNARMSLTVNGVARPDTTVAGSGPVFWQWALPLDSNENSLVISAFDLVDSTTTEKAITVRFDSLALDTLPPVIADIAVNGTSIDTVAPFRTTLDSVTVRVIAFDQGSGISTLSIDSIAVAPASDSTPFMWTRKTRTTHSLLRQTVVRAVDAVGNTTAQSLVLFRNRPPYLAAGLDNPCQVGQTYLDTLFPVDPDGDAYTVALEAGPAGLVLNGNTVTWTPLATDVGYRTVALRLSDGYDDVTESRLIQVAGTVNAPCSLSVTARGAISSGVLTLAAEGEPDALVYTVHDADPGYLEHYTVTIAWGATVLSKSIDTSRTFEVTVDPRGMASDSEALAVVVEDAGQHRDTMSLTIVRQETQVTLYRLRCTISFADMTQKPGLDLYGIPLLVRLTSDNFDFGQVTAKGGFRVTKPDGTSMPYEIERWEPDSQRGEIWVLVDTLYIAGGQHFGLTWDPTLDSSTSQPSNVFGTNNYFSGVWHLGDGGAGAGGLRTNRDATAYRNDAADFASGPVVNGAVGQGQEFDGIDDYLSIADAVSLRPQYYTIMFWYYAPAVFKGQSFVSKPYRGTWGSVMSSSYRVRCDLSGNLAASGAFGGSDETAQSGSSAPAGVWTHCAASFDGMSFYLYINGVNVTTIDPDLMVSYDAHALLLGADSIAAAGGTVAGAFRGILDEVSVSSQRRYSSWVRVTYENQRPGSRMITVAPEIVAPGPSGGGTFKMGDTLAHYGSDDGGNVGLLFGIRASLDRTATVDSFSIYVTNAAGQVRMGIYDNSGAGGQAGKLLAQTAPFTPAMGWNTTPAVSPVTLPPGTYWICAEQNSNSLRYGAQWGRVGTLARWAYGVPYGPLPSVAPTMPNSDVLTWSFYATMRPQ